MADELLTPGKGKFRIKRVKTHEEKVDQYGVVINEPLKTKKLDRKVMLVVDVTDSKGNKGTVFEHLTMNISWKIEQICKACDMAQLYIPDSACFDRMHELEGCMGECIVGISEADAQWPEKTIIAKYVVPKAVKAPPVAFMAELDEELPF